MRQGHATLLAAAIKQLDTPRRRIEGRRKRRPDAEKHYRWTLYWQVPGAIRLLLAQSGYNNAQIDEALARIVRPLR